MMVRDSGLLFWATLIYVVYTDQSRNAYMPIADKFIIDQIAIRNINLRFSSSLSPKLH